MIDYWEAIGRLATYSELNVELGKLDATNKKRAPALVYKDGSAFASGLDIDKDDFEQVQNFVAPILTEQSLSLIAAGELIWDYSFEEARAAIDGLNDVIGQATPELFGPSTAYFISLGKVIVDYTIRQTLLGAGRDAVNLLPRLSTRERENVLNLVEMKEFRDYCDQFAFVWKPGCVIGAVFSAGYIQPTGMWAKRENGRLVATESPNWIGVGTTAGWK